MASERCRSLLKTVQTINCMSVDSTMQTLQRDAFPAALESPNGERRLRTLRCPNYVGLKMPVARCGNVRRHPVLQREITAQSIAFLKSPLLIHTHTALIRCVSSRRTSSSGCSATGLSQVDSKIDALNREYFNANLFGWPPLPGDNQKEPTKMHSRIWNIVCH